MDAQTLLENLRKIRRTHAGDTPFRVYWATAKIGLGLGLEGSIGGRVTPSPELAARIAETVGDTLGYVRHGDVVLAQGQSAAPWMLLTEQHRRPLLTEIGIDEDPPLEFDVDEVIRRAELEGLLSRHRPRELQELVKAAVLDEFDRPRLIFGHHSRVTLEQEAVEGSGYRLWRELDELAQRAKTLRPELAAKAAAARDAWSGAPAGPVGRPPGEPANVRRAWGIAIDELEEKAVKVTQLALAEGMGLSEASALTRGLATADIVWHSHALRAKLPKPRS